MIKYPAMLSTAVAIGVGVGVWLWLRANPQPHGTAAQTAGVLFGIGVVVGGVIYRSARR